MTNIGFNDSKITNRYEMDAIGYGVKVS
jgi:hypothetical protein